MRRIICIFIIVALTAIYGCSIPDNVGNESEPEITPSENTEQDIIVDPDTEAKEILDSLTIEEKIGQLLVVGFPGGISDSDLIDYIERYKVGGFILFSRNFNDFDSLYSLTEKLKKWNAEKNPLPLFICIDEEGGTVSRLPKEGTKFPDAQTMGKIDDIELTYKTGEVIGEELNAVGINVDFAPVLDIVTIPENKLLIKRSYGSTPEIVSKHGNAFIEGIQSKGVIATAKHFPGHGSTNIDSHGKLPLIDIERDTFYSRELIPFKNSIDNGLDAIMVGHLSYPKLDPSNLPATMSEYFLVDLLRKELDFKGIAFSDDIEMSGYSKGQNSLEESVLTSFNGGLDVFLIGHSKEVQDKVLDTLTKGLAEGSISEARLNESVLRIIKIKLKYELSDKMKYNREEAREYFGNKEHKEILNSIKKSYAEAF
jgi:beta-N-acetylhexosaminidase